MPVQPPPAEGFDQAKLYMWVKGLESKVNGLVRQADILKNDFIKRTNDLKKDAKTLNADLLELKREQQKTQEKMDLVIKELKQTAGSEEVTMIKKYMDYWNPMTFVTQRDVERIVETKLQEEQKT
ncbi:hypothetical protein HYX14_04605 [Candidatus Woesearchaeota archaeon]|nr:hypothetical protein [Candidatus Woesearchaeota archaeon]